MIVLNGIKFGILLAFLIGPVFFTILQTSIERGFSNGALVALGVSLSDVVYVGICYFGLSQMMADGQFRYQMAIVGGAILILFGLYYLLVKSRRGLQGAKAAAGKGFFRYIIKGFLINALSPMVPVFWIGTIGIATLDFGYNEPVEFLIFFGCMLATVLLTDILKAFLADQLRRLVTPRSLRIMNVVMGVVLIGFGVRLMMLAPSFDA
jgi:threonine/homoserine/homoserine lactone efflux protein